jgi:hypothetical protein
MSRAQGLFIIYAAIHHPARSLKTYAIDRSVAGTDAMIPLKFERDMYMWHGWRSNGYMYHIDSTEMFED